MTFFSIIVRGLTRRPIRTGLTLVGISIGIAAVVALVGVSRGFEKSWETGLKARGTDIVVSKMGSSLAPKPFSESVASLIAKLPNVAALSSQFVELLSIESSQMMMLSGRQWDGYAWDNLKLISGRKPLDDQELAVVLGRTAADVLAKKVGDPLQIEAEELTVVGIFDGGAVVENGSAVLALPLLQAIMGEEGRINVIDVRVTPGTSEDELKQLCKEIVRVVPDVSAMAAGEHLSNSQSFRMVKAMSWGTSLLAVLVGVLGVMNTMLMTVSERKQEISVLLALGWKPGRIVRMVLWESALLGLLGGIAGVLMGVAGVKLMQNTEAIRGLLEPDLSMGLLLTSIGIAVVVGVVSGIYPAWRSSRITPALALQG